MQHLTNTKDEQICPQWVQTCNPSNALPADLWLTLRAEYYTGCPRRNVPDFGRVFLMLKYTDITQNTYVQI